MDQVRSSESEVGRIKPAEVRKVKRYVFRGMVSDVYERNVVVSVDKDAGGQAIVIYLGLERPDGVEPGKSVEITMTFK